MENITACILCNSVADGTIVTLGDKGITSLENACVIRGAVGLKNTINEYQGVGKQITAHKECRKRFTDLRKIISGDEKELTPPPSKKTRSLDGQFNWEKCCLFCGDECDSRHPDRTLVCAVETIPFRNNILQMCEKYPADPHVASVSHRVRNCIDLPAVNARYHKPCMVNFFMPKYNSPERTENDERDNVDLDQRPARPESETRKQKAGKPKDPVVENAFTGK